MCSKFFNIISSAEGNNFVNTDQIRLFEQKAPGFVKVTFVDGTDKTYYVEDEIKTCKAFEVFTYNKGVVK